jgi:hypothetical protein
MNLHHHCTTPAMTLSNHFSNARQANPPAAEKSLQTMRRNPCFPASSTLPTRFQP